MTMYGIGYIYSPFRACFVFKLNVYVLGRVGRGQFTAGWDGVHRGT